jgi:glycolate oxidase FAD binding subunit
MSSIVQTLTSIVGSDAVVAWESLAPDWQTQIAQAVVPNPAIECVVYPTTTATLAEVMSCAYANRWRVLPCGNGSKLHWGGLAQGIQVVVSTARLNQLVEHASGDLTVTAEAGMPLAQLQAMLATAGQFLAVDPAFPDRATLGGIVATADTGAWRQRYGGIRDMLIGLSMVRTDGKVAKAGGRVVKNVAGYDLMKLLTGSYGTLGILSQVTFRIYPLPAASQTVVLTGTADLIAKATAVILASVLSPTALDLLTPAIVAKLGLGSGIGLGLRFQSIDVSVAQQSEQVLQIGQNLGLAATRLEATVETSLWQQLRTQIDVAPPDLAITCKIGVEPSQAVATLSQIHQLASNSLGRIHAGSGLGIVQLPVESSAVLSTLRQFCQTRGGFLTVLAASADLKQHIEPWGYSGNALSVMQRLKAQFDPEHLLSPHRFVGV